MPIIEVKNLSKTFDYYKKEAGLKASIKSLFNRKKLFKTAIDDISFNIEEGEFVGFLGPNGAGKTTTLKVLSGILHPSAGECTVLNHTPYNREKDYQMEFALVMGQKSQLWWDLPAMDSFVLNKEIYEVPTEDFKKNILELTELLGITDILDVQVRKLSLGQRMKCELVAALLHKPKVLFLDEPTIGLDVVAQKNIRDFLKKYNKENKTTIILTSHYMEDIKELCERVIIIDHGKIGFDGNLDELVKNTASQKVLKLEFEQKVTKSELNKFGKVINFDPYSAELSIERDNIRKVASDILASTLPISDIAITEVPIDDVIKKYLLINNMRNKLLALLILPLLFLSGCDADSQHDEIDKVTINQNTWNVELATGRNQQIKGLSGRRNLPPNTGMLFIFGTSTEHTFWMKNMRFSLDIIWLNKGRVVKISHNLPPEGERPTFHYNSTVPVDSVLEINANEARVRNLRIGDEVVFE